MGNYALLITPSEIYTSTPSPGKDMNFWITFVTRRFGLKQKALLISLLVFLSALFLPLPLKLLPSSLRIQCTYNDFFKLRFHNQNSKIIKIHSTVWAPKKNSAIFVFQIRNASPVIISITVLIVSQIKATTPSAFLPSTSPPSFVISCASYWPYFDIMNFRKEMFLIWTN